MSEINASSSGNIFQVNWINEYRTELINIYYKTSEERALRSYSIYMLRLLDDVVRMERGPFYTYERIILEEPMRLVIKYFVEQANCYLAGSGKHDLNGDGNLTDYTLLEADKIRILEELDVVVHKIHISWKGIIDNTANADRRIFTTMAVEANVYSLSPKIMSYYSMILDRLLELYNKKDTYAFILSPSVRYYFYTKALYQMRKQLGKVIVIDVPESFMDQIDVVPVYLLHEAYHVLTRSARKRRFRAQNLFLSVRNQLRTLLFDGVRFTDDSKKEKELQKVFMGKILDSKSILSEMEDKPLESREFYADAIKKDMLEKMDLAIDEVLNKAQGILAAELTKMYNNKNYIYILRNIEPNYRRMVINAQEIRRQRILDGIVERYLRLYSECYSDFATIITLLLPPSTYNKIFIENMPYSVSGKVDYDYERDIRRLLVSKAVVQLIADEKSYLADNKNRPRWANKNELDELETQWLDSKNELERIVKSKSHSMHQINIPDGNKSTVNKQFMVNFLSVDDNLYKEYFQACGETFVEHFRKCYQKLDDFRMIIKKADLESILTDKSREQLSNIVFSGD